jgi:hypothetical protein
VGDRLLRPAAPLKTVHVMPRADALKAIYYDWQTDTLRPNLVFVDGNGRVLFETNEIGLKGEAVDETRKLAVVWGDSVVFGAGKGWARLLDADAPGYQFLNGGIEGDPYDNILRRARLLNRQRPVALNLVMLGWHRFEPYWAALADPGRSKWWPRRQPETLSAPERYRADVAAFLEEVPNTVVLTTPTALNRRILGKDLSGEFRAGDDDTVFQYVWPALYSVGLQRQIYDFISRRNEIAIDVAMRAKVPVVDLFAAFDTTELPDFRRDFVDFMHFRVSAYPQIVAAISRGISHTLVEADHQT